jgi:hypothetical protein
MLIVTTSLDVCSVSMMTVRSLKRVLVFLYAIYLLGNYVTTELE